MTVTYISVDLPNVSTEFLSEVLGPFRINETHRALVYNLKDDVYFLSLSTVPNIQVMEIDIELACDTQDDFIQSVKEHKLLKLLG